MAGLLLLLGLAGTIPDGLSFTPWFASKGVAVEIARMPDGIPWIRGTSELAAPAPAVGAVVCDFDRYKKILSPALKLVRVLSREDGSVRLHLVWPYPFPFRNRDAVVAYRLEQTRGGGLSLSWTDAARPGDPREGVRIRRVAGETRIEPAGADACRVIYTYLGDLGGRFPRWAEEKVWKAEPVEYMQALRRAVGLPLEKE